MMNKDQQFISLHRHTSPHQLALQASRYPDIDLPQAIIQIAGRQAIATKIPSWYAIDDITYPEHLPLEQCSSEQTALYKASLATGKTLVDLTGGFGIDCSFMSSKFEAVTYVERQEGLCTIARSNFRVLGLSKIHVVNADAVDYLAQMPPCDYIFIDPARRNQAGGKVFRVSDCEPDVEKLAPLLLEKSPLVLVKLSPMLDLTQALKSLPHTAEVHIVSVQNECKELLLLLKRGQTGSIPIRCVNFTHETVQEFLFTREEETNAMAHYADTVEAFLYEPNSSLMKAGSFTCLTQRYGLKKLHRHTHLYTSQTLVEEFPGRIFQVSAYGSMKEKTLLAGITRANVATRNFPLPAETLRKRLKLGDGGEAYLFGATIRPEKRIVIVCRKVNL